MNEPDANIFCSFCNEGFGSAKAIGDHLLMCGNKTDQCPTCQQFIRRAIFAYHYENDCANPDASTTDDETPEKPKDAERPRVSIKCEFCKQNYDKIDRKAHKANCLRNPENLAKKQQPFTDEYSNQNTNRSYQTNDSDDDTLIPCEYCKKGIQWHRYDNHTKACQDEEHQRLLQKQSRRTNRDVMPTADTGTAPCMYCARPMSLNGLSYHQLYCTRNARRNKN